MVHLVTTKDVQVISGATFKQLDYWCRRGWIPDMPTETGTGNRRVWTSEAVEVAKRLVAASKLCTPEQDLPFVADFVRRAAEAGVKP
jgi:DNA-binding transcriptional MerR regulator